MSSKEEGLKKIFQMNNEFNDTITAFWHNYSDFDTWQFWLAVFMLLFPLVLLYFTIDRKRIFELFFFGYTVHILWTYIDVALEQHNYWYHTFFITPYLPNAIDVTASFLPVGYILVYQYCTKHRKNFLIYTLLLSAIFAFGAATIEKSLGLLEFNKGASQLHLFLIDTLITLVAFVATRLLVKFQKGAQGDNRTY